MSKSIFRRPKNTPSSHTEVEQPWLNPAQAAELREQLAHLGLLDPGT